MRVKWSYVLTAFLLLIHPHEYTYIYTKCLGHNCGYLDHFLIAFTRYPILVDYMLPEVEFQLK